MLSNSTVTSIFVTAILESITNPGQSGLSSDPHDQRCPSDSDMPLCAPVYVNIYIVSKTY